MELRDRIIAYITASNGLVSLEKLVDKAKSAGFSEGEVLAVLSNLGKKLKSTVRGDQVYYQIPPAVKTPTDHLAWVRANYPPMTPETDGSGIDIDLSWMFLKTKEDRDEFMALASGRPVYMIKNKYEKRK
jgi:hypothetical protein